MNERDRQILIKLIKETAIVADLIQGCSIDDFLADERTKRAVCMTLINIGELVKNLSDEFRSAYSDIPWKAICGLRDITAHKYQTLQMEDVWLTTTKDIPLLKEKLALIR